MDGHRLNRTNNASIGNYIPEPSNHKPPFLDPRSFSFWRTSKTSTSKLKPPNPRPQTPNPKPQSQKSVAKSPKPKAQSQKPEAQWQRGIAGGGDRGGIDGRGAPQVCGEPFERLSKAERSLPTGLPTPTLSSLHSSPSTRKGFGLRWKGHSRHRP